MYIHVSSMCGNLISPALSSLMMGRTGPWPCLYVGAALLTTGAILFLFMPETLHHKSVQEQAEGTESPSDTKSWISHTFDRFKESLSIINSISLLLLILSTFISMPVAYSMLQFMAQFLSKRYDIKLSQTGYVQSVNGVCQLIQAFVILPWLSKLILSSATPAKIRASDEHHRDLGLARLSGGILILGSLTLGLAPTLPVFIFGLVLLTLGSAYNSLGRSLMSLYVDPEHTSRLFTLVGSKSKLIYPYFPPPLVPPWKCYPRDCPRLR